MTLSSTVGITINAAPAAVFACITDPARAAQWGDNLHLLPASHAPIAVGMQADVALPPDDAAALLEIKQYQAPTAFSYQLTSARQVLTWTYAVDGVTAGSVVNATASVDTAGTVAHVEDEVQGDTPVHRFLGWAMMELASGPLLGTTATEDLEEAAGPREQDLQQHLQNLLNGLKALVESGS